mgnify:CR=1 FL=1
MSRGNVTVTDESAYPQQAEFHAQMEEQKTSDRARFKKQQIDEFRAKTAQNAAKALKEQK